MRKYSFIMILLLLVCLSSCTKPEIAESRYYLYFPVNNGESHGQAIQGIPYHYEGEGEPSVYQLIDALLNGPTEEGYVSPFPKKTAIRWYEQGENGVADISFSEEYSGLTGISLTLADYCVTLTLAQLEGIESVEITAVGQPVGYRNHEQLKVQDILPLNCSCGKENEHRLDK